MSAAYPEMLRSDACGVRNAHGRARQLLPEFAGLSPLQRGMARSLAERYKDHPALMLWHVSNEYGGRCLCETCETPFREWLQAQIWYAGRT